MRIFFCWFLKHFFLYHYALNFYKIVLCGAFAMIHCSSSSSSSSNTPECVIFECVINYNGRVWRMSTVRRGKGPRARFDSRKGEGRGSGERKLLKLESNWWMVVSVGSQLCQRRRKPKDPTIVMVRGDRSEPVVGRQSGAPQQWLVSGDPTQLPWQTIIILRLSLSLEVVVVSWCNGTPRRMARKKFSICSLYCIILHLPRWKLGKSISPPTTHL